MPCPRLHAVIFQSAHDSSSFQPTALEHFALFPNTAECADEKLAVVYLDLAAEIAHAGQARADLSAHTGRADRSRRLTRKN